MNLTDRIFAIRSAAEFEAVALEVFRLQAVENPVYREYLERLSVDAQTVRTLAEVPFLPIGFFRSHRVVTGTAPDAVLFRSSGTTGSTTNVHHVTDTALYERSFREGFRLFYGDPGKYCILALLPSYLERSDSSLVYMADRLIRDSGHPASGFCLDRLEELHETLLSLQARRQPTILLGVTFALLDFAERYRLDWPELIVMETGGMKGRRKELVREEVHALLQSAFGVPQVHSEYGMTELLSQAYSDGAGIFRTPPWMKILLRDPNDPFAVRETGSGGINVIDLANLHSCSFLETGDLGRALPDGGFTVLGRFDNADLRGCNLLVV
jgi:phenylacetate-coenzyme A ligase PaaK-like adenylate-forming protein